MMLQPGGWTGLVSYFIRLPPVGSGTKLVWIWFDYISLSLLPSFSIHLLSTVYLSSLLLTLSCPSVSSTLFFSSPASISFSSGDPSVWMWAFVSELLYLCANVSVMSAVSLIDPHPLSLQLHFFFCTYIHTHTQTHKNLGLEKHHILRICIQTITWTFF